MHNPNYRAIARALFSTHGIASEAEASERAEEHIANIDVGGFAYWKRVEGFIRVLHDIRA